MANKKRESITGLSQFQFETGLLNALKDTRLAKTKVHEFATPSEAIVYLILHHSGVQWRAVVDNIPIEAVFSRPSLIALVNGDLLSVNQIILVLLRIIESISKFLGSNTTQSAEELAWIIYEKYGGWTLEDFLIFSQKSKKIDFSTIYQHVSTKRGLTGEHLLRWLEKYECQRVESRHSLANKFRSNKF